jgi:rubrerythrin
MSVILQGWQCPECGYLMSDLAKRSLVDPGTPCPRCGRSTGSFVPVTTTEKADRAEAGE